MTTSLDALFVAQDGIVTREQALQSLSPDELDSRLGRRWQVILPGVYAGFTGSLTERQRLRSGLLKAGQGAMLSDVTALRGYRMPYLPDDSEVRVLVPDTVHRASRDFLVVRRSTRCPRSQLVDGLPAAPAYRALCEFVTRYADERVSLAVAAAVLQRRRASLEQLIDEARLGPARGRPRLLRVIAALESGVQSLPEDDVRRLVARSRILPEPLWNPVVVLPDGCRLRPDALFEDSGVIHETNGRDVHAGLREFDDMQRRHDQLTAAGFTVLHNSPRRIRQDGSAVIAELEQCHQRLAGRGIPEGVVVLRPSDGASLGKSA